METNDLPHPPVPSPPPPPPVDEAQVGEEVHFAPEAHDHMDGYQLEHQLHQKSSTNVNGNFARTKSSYMSGAMETKLKDDSIRGDAIDDFIDDDDDADNDNDDGDDQQKYSNDVDESTKTDDLEDDNTVFTIIQVSNVASIATLEQMRTLFGFLGDIRQIELYAQENVPENSSKVAFIKYSKPWSVLIAQHLTNTVFIDRALIVLPYKKSIIPDRETAFSGMTSSMLTKSCGVMNQFVVGTGGTQMIATIDPHLTALGLPQYPHLPANIDASRVEEIRRTIYVGNLDAALTSDQIMKFFNNIGEVKYIRLTGDDSQPTRFAFVEFTHQSSIANALQYNGHLFGSRSLKINHSNNAITKPLPKLDRHHEEAERKIRERNRSRDRNYPSKYDRDRSRHRDDRRDLERRDERGSRSRRSRTPESYSRRSRSRSFSRERRRSRSRDRNHRRRSRSRERETRRRSGDLRRRPERERSRTPPPKRKRRRRRR